MKMRTAHLSLHCTSHLLLMLNSIWLALISIISPENGAMNESDDGGEGALGNRPEEKSKGCYSATD